MVQPKKQVFIQLKTVINDTGEIEKNEVKFSGVFSQKGSLDVLTYKENLEDQGEVSTLITIQPDKVSIKRTGIVSMHQQFRIGRVTENVYQHPHGNIHMETLTDKASYTPLEKGESGNLQLGYTTKLNGQNERKHTLDLAFTEEDAQ